MRKDLSITTSKCARSCIDPQRRQRTLGTEPQRTRHVGWGARRCWTRSGLLRFRNPGDTLARMNIFGCPPPRPRRVCKGVYIRHPGPRPGDMGRLLLAPFVKNLCQAGVCSTCDPITVRPRRGILDTKHSASHHSHPLPHRHRNLGHRKLHRVSW